MTSRRTNTQAKQRAARLLEEVREHAWIIEFIQGPTGRNVHVVAADADQPPVSDNIVEHMLVRRFRLVCGPILRLGPYGGTLCQVFNDELLCGRCHDAFPTHDDQALLFEHNTELWAPRSASANAHTRQLRRIDEDRQAKVAEQTRKPAPLTGCGSPPQSGTYLAQKPNFPQAEKR